MPDKNKLFLVALLLPLSFWAQNLKAVYKAEDLLKRISSKDTLFVVNFWASWCKPCMEELQAIDSVGQTLKGTNKKLLFVNLDFIEKQNKVNQLLAQKNIQSDCVLLDEVNGNVYIDKISSDWSGDIPATLLQKGDKKLLIARKLSFAQLVAAINEFRLN